MKIRNLFFMVFVASAFCVGLGIFVSSVATNYGSSDANINKTLNSSVWSDMDTKAQNMGAELQKKPTNIPFIDMAYALISNALTALIMIVEAPIKIASMISSLFISIGWPMWVLAFISAAIFIYVILEIVGAYLKTEL